MPPATQRSAFFAYGSESTLTAEAMRDAASSASERGLSSQTWEDLPIAGRGIIDTILRAIDAADIVVAEVSTMNSNVLFELGYAIATGKRTLIAFDDTDAQANDLWKRVGVLSNVGRSDYGANSERLAAAVLSADTEGEELLLTLLGGGPEKDDAGIFAPIPPLRMQPVDVLSKLLVRETSLEVYAAAEELGIAPLDYYVKTAFRCSAAMLHLLGPQRVHAREHNARASLLAGFCVGFGIPTLMVAESSFTPPLDYKDLLYIYPTSAALAKKAKAWLQDLPTDSGTRRKMGKLQLEIELPIQTFGQYVAENERADLAHYYVDTRELHSVIAGQGRLFVGRKGTGKTATMTQAVLELRRDSRNLVVPIKPTAYELSGVVELVSEFDGKNRQYALVSTWLYLLYTEIALRALRFLEDGPKGALSSEAATELRRLTADFDFDTEDDISARLEKAVARLVGEAHRKGETTHDFVSRNLQLHKLAPLNRALSEVLSGIDRVCILVDNLDKTWEADADHPAISEFILSLLVASGRVESEFGKSVSGRDKITVSLTAFLRTDIFDHVVASAREPDKISPLHIEWRDEELLERVLVDRYVAKRSRKRRQDPRAEIWEDVFAAEVKGLPTRDYLFWRALQRPRDIIYFANAALTTAINRKHASIMESDVVHAELDYSRFAFEALVVESQAQEFNLEEVLFEFVGADAVLSAPDAMSMLEGISDPGAVRDWLVSSSFLGVEVRPGDFRHVEGATEARKQLKLASRFKASQGNDPVQYRIHPAFRPYLEIQDSDLHRA